MEIKERILKALKENGQLATYKLKVFAKVGYDKDLKNALEELVKENKIEKIEVNKGTYWKLKK
jgi:predicted HTH transcriptional regulator